MDKRLIILGLIFIQINSLVSVTSEKIETNINENIYVDDDNTEGPWDGTFEYPYQYIQDGIDSANPFDMIYVLNGTYVENIVIDKRVLLIGENQTNTIIDASGKQDAAVTLKSQDIEVCGFTVKNAKGVWLNYCAGFRILADHCKIYNNTIRDNMFGIQGSHVTNISIFNNKFINDGILFGRGDVDSDLKHYQHNIYNNTVNDKPLVYLENKNNYVFSEEVGQLILVNSTNVTINKIRINNTDFPIIFAYCNNCKIINSKIDSCTGEIWLTNCDKLIIEKNNISNIAMGVCLQFNSNNNSIQKNNILNCTLSGIALQSNSKNNKITDNFIAYNNKGISIEESEKNNISNNTIYENTKGGLILSKSDKNDIFYNNFIGNNKPSACIINSFFNKWNENYWERCRFTPKTIPGFVSIGKYYIYKFSIPFPSLLAYLNFDFHPKSEQYEIQSFWV